MYDTTEIIRRGPNAWATSTKVGGRVQGNRFEQPPEGATGQMTLLQMGSLTTDMTGAEQKYGVNNWMAGARWDQPSSRPGGASIGKVHW
jgi:hypothetical protein